MPCNCLVFDFAPMSNQDSMPGRIPTNPFRLSRFKCGSDKIDRLLSAMNWTLPGGTVFSMASMKPSNRTPKLGSCHPTFGLRNLVRRNRRSSLMISRFEIAPGREFRIKAFHPSSLSVLPLDVSIGEAESIVVQDADYEVYPVSIGIVGQKLTMFFTAEGLLVKDVEQDGTVVIEYVP